MKTNEPMLTQQLSEEDLKKIVQTPMEVGRYPVHGREWKSCVREVTATSEAVFGQEGGVRNGAAGPQREDGRSREG